MRILAATALAVSIAVLASPFLEAATAQAQEECAPVAGGQNPQPIDGGPGEAGGQPSSSSCSGASGLALALTRRGLLHREAVRYDAALADFDEAIAIDPDCRLAWFARATTHWMLGDISRARLDFDQLIRFKRRDSDPRVEEL